MWIESSRPEPLPIDAKLPKTARSVPQSSQSGDFQPNLAHARWMLWIILLLIGGYGWLFSRLLLTVAQSIAPTKAAPIEQQISVSPLANSTVTNSKRTTQQRQFIGYVDYQNLQAQLTQEEELAVLVPTAAIVQQGTRAGVYVKSGDRVKFQPIQSGITIGNQTEVLSGLEGDEQILLSLPNGSNPVYLVPFLLDYQ